MAGAGYEEQLTPDVEARFQDFINAPSSDAVRLRDAFAQLLAQGNDKAAPIEAVWALQGQNQLPRPPQVQQWDLPVGSPNDYAPMPQQSMNPPGMSFPTAPMGPGSPLQSRKVPDEMPKVPDEPPKPQQDPAPFHGKGSYMGAYKLPEKKNKKGKG